ncbi:MAG TPA: hypothetical protein VFQ83_04660 [Candidatus Udaeobacter sp.]|jgi:hypothetical protein|nr:hypothetical protein [Candidatus Udaeobacter sp.]
MKEVNPEDWLDRELRESAPYIDDGGFTVRVLQQLPRPRRSHDVLRAAILLGMTLLASVLAYFVSGGGRFISVTIERLAALPTLWVFGLAAASGLAIAAGGAAAAISRAEILLPGRR